MLEHQGGRTWVISEVPAMTVGSAHEAHPTRWQRWYMWQECDCNMLDSSGMKIILQLQQSQIQTSMHRDLLTQARSQGCPQSLAVLVDPWFWATGWLRLLTWQANGQPTESNSSTSLKLVIGMVRDQYPTLLTIRCLGRHDDLHLASYALNFCYINQYPSISKLHLSQTYSTYLCHQRNLVPSPLPKLLTIALKMKVLKTFMSVSPGHGLMMYLKNSQINVAEIQSLWLCVPNWQTSLP